MQHCSKLKLHSSRQSWCFSSTCAANPLTLALALATSSPPLLLFHLPLSLPSLGAPSAMKWAIVGHCRPETTCVSLMRLPLPLPLYLPLPLLLPAALVLNLPLPLPLPLLLPLPWLLPLPLAFSLPLPFALPLSLTLTWAWSLFWWAWIFFVSFLATVKTRYLLAGAVRASTQTLRQECLSMLHDTGAAGVMAGNCLSLDGGGSSGDS